MGRQGGWIALAAMSASAAYSSYDEQKRRAHGMMNAQNQHLTNPWAIANAYNQAWLDQITLSQNRDSAAFRQSLMDQQARDATNLIARVVRDNSSVMRIYSSANCQSVETAYEKVQTSHAKMRELLQRRKPKTAWQKFCIWLSRKKEADRAIEYVVENLGRARNEWHKSSVMWRKWARA